MKQHKCGIVVIVFLLALVWWQPSIHADGEYSINRLKENVQIHPDGSATVHYQIRYEFADDMHGVYVTQATDKGVDFAEWTQASINGKRQGKYHGGSAGMQIVNSNNAKQLRIYYPIAADDTLNAQWTYKLNNVVTRYHDVAEINWQIIGGQWAVPLKNVDITVKLPKGKQQHFAYWTHSLNTAKFTGDAKAGVYHYTAASVAANTPVELHTYFDESTVPQVPKTAGNGQAKIIAQEEQIAARLQRAKQLRLWIQVGLVSLMLIGAFLIYRAKRFYAHAKAKAGLVITGINNYELPSENAPAVVLAQLNGKHFSLDKAFSATIMDLLARHYYRLTDQTNWSQKHFELTLIKNDGLTSFEKTVTLILFGNTEIGAKVDTRTFKKTDSRVVKRLSVYKEKFNKDIENAALPVWLRDERGNVKFKLAYLLGLFSLIVLVGSQIAMLVGSPYVEFYPWLGVVLLVASLGILFGVLDYRKMGTIYTPTGWSEAQAWKNFGQMLREVGQFDLKKVPDVTLWDRYLAYAVVLNAADNVAKALQQYHADDANYTDDFIPTYLAYNLFSVSLMSDMTGLDSANAPKESAGFGVSGGSGGFGGGSGGGAF
ncbi:DUF2207 domain-containing protein [Periweissella cryptocerci]|uniref:DUF2207 domain-containing protein n=1 Tax=Periweissella cryptocerci TaxID=2506420 RepID=A0A4P6YW11_9LACO|nr:DUF2207 domain-containing protein [Periweissella cryptocerci]QBO37022.1 DUF2207 domain-containing protein [Periweissella cryptocerci]